MKELPEEARKELLHFYQTAERYAERVSSYKENAYQEYVSFVRRFAKKQDRLLDLGCGSGLSTFMFSHFAKEVTGVDISPILIQIAKEKHRARNIEFRRADILNLPFPNESYDIVSSFLTIEHLYDIAGALSEMVRVAKIGGLIIILAPNLMSPFNELYNLADAVFVRKNRLPWQKKSNPWKAIYLAMYNAGLLFMKSLRRKESFSYRLPILENRFDVVPDNDAVYLANPIDLKFWFKRKGLKIIKYQGETMWGRIFPCFATGIHFVGKKE